MLKKILPFFFTILLGSTGLYANEQVHSFTVNEIMPGIQKIDLIQTVGTQKEIIGTISVITKNIFSIFITPAFEAVDKSDMPDAVFRIVDVVKTLNNRNELDSTIMLGDLYVSSEHRGRGYAHKLVARACDCAKARNAKKAVLIPDPFEYVNGEQKSLEGTHYEECKEQLISLYQQCGFTTDTTDTTLFMHKNL